MTALHEVHLLEVPVALWARSTEQAEALQREFALVRSDPSDVPARLLALVEAVRAQYASASSRQEEELLDAADAGVEVLPDLVYEVPAEVAQAARDLEAMFEEADAHCRAGDHLLTLAADEDVVRFRRWFLGQFVAQLEGAAPVPWPAA